MSLEFEKDGKMFTTEKRGKLSYKNTQYGGEENRRMQLTENEGQRERETQTHLNFPLMNDMIGIALWDLYLSLLIMHITD